MPKALLPHRGHIFIDWDANEAQYFLLHGLTRERVTLGAPHGAWRLEYFEDDFAAIVDDSEDEGRLVDEMLSVAVYRDTDTGDMWLERQGAQGSVLSRFEGFDRHHLRNAHVRAGPTHAAIKMQIAVFHRPRSLCQVFWDLLQFYRVAGFVAGKGASDWLYRGIGRWERRLRTAGIPGLLLRSRMLGGDMAVVNLSCCLCRVLPFPTVDTIGLVALLALWSNSSRGSTGLRRTEDRMSCQFIMEGLCLSLAGEWVLHIFLDRELTFDWPARPHGEYPLRLPAHGATIDLRPVSQVPRERRGQVRHLVLDQMRAQGDSDGFASVWRVMQFLAEVGPDAKTMFAQVSWQVGMRIDQKYCGVVFNNEGSEGVQLDDAGFSFEDASDARLFQRLAAYHLASIDAAAEHKDSLSITCDKSRVFGKGLLNCAVALPNNVAFWAAPKVIPDYRSRSQLLRASGEHQAAAEETTMRRKRQSDWLLRAQSAWRARKRHRAHAHEWIQATNSALQVSCGVEEGWRRFQQPARSEERGDPFTWPYISVAADRGGDGRAAAAYLQRVLRINLDMLGDPSHDINNDLDAGLRRADLWAFKTLLLACYNVQHGPWSEDTRFAQVLEGLDEIFDEDDPHTSPLFQALAPSILSDLGGAAVSEGVADLTTFLWEQLFFHGPWRKKYSKVNASKFLAAVTKFKEEEQWFHMRLFGYLHIALEMNMLTTAQLKKIMVPAREEASTGGEESVPLRRPLPEESTLRNTCKNSVTLACAVFSDGDNLVRQRLICRLAEPWRQWFTTQSAELRSCPASLPWELRQTNGGEYMGCCREVFRLLTSFEVLAGIGFRTRFEVNEDGQVPLDDVAIQREDDFAWHAAEFAIGLNGARLRRGLELLRGWPQRAAMMSNSTSGQECVNILRHDYELWEQMSRTDNNLLKTVCSRSSFNTVAVQQLVAICKKSAWTWTPEIGAWVTKKHQRFRASQACEDAFKRQRRREARGQNRRGQTARCFGVILEREVLNRVHHFKEVEATDCHLPFGSTLPDDAFKYRQDTTLPYKDIIGFSSAPKWHSPSAEGQATEHADHCLLQYLRAKNRPDLLENMWLSCFFKVPGLILRRRDTAEQGWLCPIAEIPGSSGLGWKLRVVYGDGNSAGDLLAPECERGGCVDITLLDIDEWDARAIQWRSPFWAWRTSLGRQVGRRADGVLAEAARPPEPLFTVAARQGFWRFDLVVLKKIARLQGMDLDHCADEFEMCWRLVSAILGTDDEEVLLQCMHQRVRSLRATSAAPNEFMEFEETEQLMNTEDSEDFKKAQKTHKRRQARLTEFLAPYKAKRQAATEARAKAAAAGRGRGRQGGRKGKGAGKGGHPWGDRDWPALIIGDSITQSSARQYLPPNSSIWESRSRTVGGWNGHFPPNPRISCSDMIAGSHIAAALSIVRQLWEQYLDFHGLDKGACPIAGVMQ